MVILELDRWGMTVDSLRVLAMQAPHPRSRERFMALFMIASGAANATTWAKQIGREDETVMNWVHAFNAKGPDAIHYRRTGGVPPFSTE